MWLGQRCQTHGNTLQGIQLDLLCFVLLREQMTAENWAHFLNGKMKQGNHWKAAGRCADLSPRRWQYTRTAWLVESRSRAQPLGWQRLKTSRVATRRTLFLSVLLQPAWYPFSNWFRETVVHVPDLAGSLCCILCSHCFWSCFKIYSKNFVLCNHHEVLDLPNVHAVEPHMAVHPLPLEMPRY